MITFLVQTINGKIKHDFSFHLLEAINYQNWIRGEKTYEVILTKEVKKEHENCIPVGTLEFVFSYMERFEKIKKQNVKPINIPIELMDNVFLKREVSIKNSEEIVLEKPTFLKSATGYKAFTDIVEDAKNIPTDIYVVSEVIEIKSEWRSFIFNGKLVGLQNYSGDFALFPCVNAVKDMIKKYTNAPTAYTLDIGINNDGTFIIEVHPFVSCGLYGFNDYKMLPQMFISAYREFVKNAKKNL